MSEAAPRRIGAHELVGKLARTGLSEQFLARAIGPHGFQKLVVIKRLLPRHAGSTRHVKQFVEEAKLAATLDHPNVAHVHELGLVGELCYFVMEHVSGQSVRALLQRTARLSRALPIEHAIAIARSAAAALHHAHERRDRDGSLLGLVHGDVSPQTVIVTYEGIVKVVEFGAPRAPVRTIDTRTKERVSYLSPEQSSGGEIDRRSDIYALGAVLWEMLTGQRYGRADGEATTQPRSPSELRSDCPPELDRIVTRALAFDPAARFETAEQFEVELEELARDQRLRQSASALRAHVQQLFAAELVSWRQIHAQIMTAAPETGTATSLFGRGASEGSDATGTNDIRTGRREDAGTDDDSEDEDADEATLNTESESDDYSEEYTQVDEAYGVIESVWSPKSEEHTEPELPPSRIDAPMQSFGQPAVFVPPPPVRSPVAPSPMGPGSPMGNAQGPMGPGLPMGVPPGPPRAPMGVPSSGPHMFAPHPSMSMQHYAMAPEWTAMGPRPRPNVLARPIVVVTILVVLFVAAFVIALLA